MLTQDSCVFYEDHVLYPTFAGVVLASDEGKSIAKALGNGKAALLGNHGLLTAGASIEAVTAWFVLLDKCCQVQLAADASSGGSGTPLVHIGKEEAHNTAAALGHNAAGYCTSSLHNPIGIPLTADSYGSAPFPSCGKRIWRTDVSWYGYRFLRFKIGYCSTTDLKMLNYEQSREGFVFINFLHAP